MEPVIPLYGYTGILYSGESSSMEIDMSVQDKAAGFRLDKRGAMTLPAEIRKGYRQRYGVDVQGGAAVLRDDGVIELHPTTEIDAAQSFFWTERWQAAEADAQEDIDAGRVQIFRTGDDFLDALDDAEDT